MVIRNLNILHLDVNVALGGIIENLTLHNVLPNLRIFVENLILEKLHIDPVAEADAR